MAKFPNEHTAIVGMVDQYGFAEVVRALAEQARRRAICHGESQRQMHKDISYLLDDCAEAIDKTN